MLPITEQGKAMTTIGIVSTGAMGSAVGWTYAQGGARVVATLTGRSQRTRDLVQDTGIDLLEDLHEVVRVSDVMISIVPPSTAQDAAGDMAAAARRTGSTPTLIELNAIAPETVCAIAELMAGAGCDVIDGSISGGPPCDPDDPTLVYLSGPGAEEISAIPAPALELRVLGDEIGTASALKMCTGSMYKGFAALALHALTTAYEHGVADEFLADISRAWPDMVPTLPRFVGRSTTKAWRYVGEMGQVATTQSAAGLPRELFDGVKVAYEAASRTPLGSDAPEDVADDLTVEALMWHLGRA